MRVQRKIITCRRIQVVVVDLCFPWARKRNAASSFGLSPARLAHEVRRLEERDSTDDTDKQGAHGRGLHVSTAAGSGRRRPRRTGSRGPRGTSCCGSGRERCLGRCGL